MLMWMSLAAATDVWVGGGVVSGVAVYGAATDGAGDPVTETAVTLPLSQAEVDLRVKSGIVFVRVDADVHLDLAQDPVLPAFPVPPEYAMIELQPGDWRLQLGVVNPEFGLQGWDEWDNYLPEYSLAWAAQPSQVVGVEPGYLLGGGATKVYAYGGFDPGWAEGWATLVDAPIFGAGIASELDFFSTWSGFFAYPTLDYYGAVVALEVYPADLLWVTLDGLAGAGEGKPVVGGQLVVNVLPEAVVNPVARAELMYDPGAWATGSAVGGGLGVNVWATDWLYVGAEGRFRVIEKVKEPAAILLIGVHRPDPPDGEAAYGEE